ncbi:MAG: oligosaccharide flippase family protein [Gemmatimonadetes bacterium]|nr:oligosaccharide flippase family protein [Gemmatimonadota bacterium]
MNSPSPAGVIESPPVQDDARTRRAVGRNAIALLFAYLLTRGFTFASVVVAARVLGTSEFGSYGTAAAYAVILSIVATLGMMPLLIREIARQPERAAGLLRAAHIVKTGSNIVMLVMLIALARWLGYETDVARASLLLGIGYALGSYAENLSAYYQAVERMHVWTQASAIFGFVSGVGGIAVVLATQDMVLFCIFPALGWSAACVWLLARAPRDVRRGVPVRRADVVALLRALLPFAAAFVLIAVYYKIDVLLLARWQTPEHVGVYSAGYKFVDIFQALVVVASAAVYPRLSRMSQPQAGQPSPAGARSLELILLCAVPVAGLLYFLAGPFITALFGASYSDSIPVLRTLALVLPFLAVTIHGGYLLAAAARMTAVAWLYLVALVVNVTLNALLIPFAAGQGAALAMVGSEALLAVGFLAVLRVLVRTGPRAPVLLAVLTVGGVGALLSVLPIFGSYGAAALFLVAVLFAYPLTGAFTARDAALLRDALWPRGAVGAGA